MNWKIYILLGIALTANVAFPRATTGQKSYKYILEGFYGMSSVNPTDLNTARQNFIWNGTSAASGNFTRLNYFGGSLGKRLAKHLLLSVRYEIEYQALPKTDVGSSMTVLDYFIYSPVLALVEFPFEAGKFSFSLGGGVGYALNFEYHQQYSGTQEDIAYKAHPIVFRGRISLGYKLSKTFGVFVEGVYDKVSAASLATDKSYSATVNGSALTSGTTFKDASGSNAVKADMSGLRYGLGLRVTF